MSHSNFVAAAELSDTESALDFSLDGITGSSNGPEPYSSAVHNIFSRHCEELRSNAHQVIGGLHTISRRRLQDIATRQNNEIFSFLQRPDRTPHQNGIAEAIFRRYGHDMPSIQRHTTPISRELNLDVSMSSAVSYFDEHLSQITFPTHYDASANPAPAPGTLASLTNQLRWALSQYRLLGGEILRLEALLEQKLATLDKLHTRAPFVTALPTNDSYPALLEAFEQYMKQVFRDSQIAETYMELAETYKRWNIMREVISVQTATSHTTATEPMCSICLNDSIAYAVVPCGHTFCSPCARKMNIQCYICRGTIREKLKLYFN
jgi:hypothetical protein